MHPIYNNENSKRAYYRGAQGCVIVYSCSDKDSFSTVDSWKHRVTNECGDIPMGKFTSGSYPVSSGSLPVSSTNVHLVDGSDC